LGKDAAVGGIGHAVRALLVRLEGGEVAVEGADRGENQGAPGKIAGIAHQVAGGEVVGAVGDDVVAGDEVEGIGGVDARRVGLHAHVRVEPGDRLPGAVDLGHADVGGIVHDLALQVV